MDEKILNELRKEAGIKPKEQPKNAFTVHGMFAIKELRITNVQDEEQLQDDFFILQGNNYASPRREMTTLYINKKSVYKIVDLDLMESGLESIIPEDMKREVNVGQDYIRIIITSTGERYILVG
jgi:hypothetical protein